MNFPFDVTQFWTYIRIHEECWNFSYERLKFKYFNFRRIINVEKYIRYEAFAFNFEIFFKELYTLYFFKFPNPWYIFKKGENYFFLFFYNLKPVIGWQWKKLIDNNEYPTRLAFWRFFFTRFKKYLKISKRG